jgi:signal transduction histidine kinase
MQAENDEMPFSPTMINLESMCREIASELQATIGVHHQFVMQIDPLPELIYADPILISRIITNLITNAVKYSPKRSEVQISLSVEQRHILMRIRDQGIGIPPEDQKYLFQSYFRASNVEEINGTGLGLRIVKEAIELHGGRIEVESQLKQGTTFTVFLPIVINSSSTSSEKKRTEQRVEKPLPIKPDPR